MNDILSNRIIVKYNDRELFWDWCQERNIQVQYCGFTSGDNDMWYIPDEKFRLLAILKWS